MNIYKPEDVKVMVDNKRIGGFIEGSFLTAGYNSVVIRLQAFSESIDDLIKLSRQYVLVEIENGVFKQGERLTNLDINETYELTDYYTKYNVDKIPEVVFVFGRP